MQRDLDFLASIVTDNSGAMTPFQRLQSLPTTKGTFIVASSIRPILGGVGYGQGVYGTGPFGGGGVSGAPLEMVSRAMMDFAWPSDASPGANIVPAYWCPNDERSILVGPAPDQSYGFEVVGTQRFVQMSAANPSNFLSQELPDLYVAASLVWLFGYQRDFGAQSDDPATAQSWEAQYGKLLQSAAVEEARKKYGDMFPRLTKPTAALKAA